jgi:nucleotide-binding universal stress UspA family protein
VRGTAERARLAYRFKDWIRFMSMSKVVIGYDASGTGERALEAGAELAAALGAEVHLVTAFSDSSGGGLQITDERRRAEQLLDAAETRIKSTGSKVTRHALPEGPADAILRVATEVGADVIVIGNRGAQGARRVLGSVASAIVGHAPCNVFVVKTT